MGLINDGDQNNKQENPNMAEVISGEEIGSTKSTFSTIKNTKKNKCKIQAIISFVFSVYFLLKGFNKMYIYEKGELYQKAKNAYVGGDAYNYIINGTHSTAFFILAIGFLLSGILWLIYGELKLQRH